jgi:predicted alpha-1,2-mannosidase
MPHNLILMKSPFFRARSAALALTLGATAPIIPVEAQNQQNLLPYVNILQGTDSTGGLSTGNTLPLVARPFAMTDWSLQTGEGNWGWWFSPNARAIQGIRATHQPSPWMGDYGYFTVMAQTGKLYLRANQRTSTYRPDESTLSPHYLKVPLRRYGTLLEMTPTERCSLFRFTFPKDEVGRVLVQMEGSSQVKIDRNKGLITGLTRTKNDNAPENFACYFAAKFDRSWKGVQLALEDKVNGEVAELDGKQAGASVEFEPGAPVVMQIGTSFISPEQALQNLNNEVGSKSFDTIRAEGQAAWNAQLNRITVQGGTPEQLRTFYSCLYRAHLFPRMFHEKDAGGKTVHYSAYDGKVHDGVSYTDNGFWDTYRTIWPLFSIIQPDRYGEMVEGFMQGYREGGWLAQWPSPGYRVSMPGTHGDAVIADAVVKGIKGFDIKEAYAAMIKHADNPSPQRGAGRNGVVNYLKLGYVPGSVSETLDFAYDDFCVAQVAESLGLKEDANRYRQRALNYRNIYDPQVGFMRAKDDKGQWRPNFNPYEWGGPYVEGGPWQSTWAVQQDPAGMIDLFGGRAKFAAKLDQQMTEPPRYEIGGYGSEIHEITEMALTNFGQYGHGNQPVHHILSLFSAAGEPWKTQYWTRRVMNELYSPQGFAGDEDNGEMGAWYVLNAMGLYPLTPGRPEYVLTSPLFKSMTIRVPGKKEITIEAPKNSDKNVYVQKVTVNGKTHEPLWISHQDLAQGAQVRFDMGPKPLVKDYWTMPSLLPHSISPYRQ